MWPRERKFRHSFASSPNCLACSAMGPETLGHRWLDCPALLEGTEADPLDEDTREHKRRVATRELMRKE
eukprot:5762842-Pyramimonas_sp.AAC.1